MQINHTYGSIGYVYTCAASVRSNHCFQDIWTYRNYNVNNILRVYNISSKQWFKTFSIKVNYIMYTCILLLVSDLSRAYPCPAVTYIPCHKDFARRLGWQEGELPLQSEISSRLGSILI